jgi:PAS domain S-box-containing protein
MGDSLRENKSRLETLLQAMPDIVFFKDSEGRHLLVNKACEEFLGLKREDIEGKSNEELMPPDVAEHCRGSDEELIRNRRPLRTEDHFTARDGRSLVLDTLKVPLYDDKGDTLGLVGISRDITERKLAEEELRRHREHLEELVEERTTELKALTDSLKEEIGERWKTEEALRRSEQRYSSFLRNFKGIAFQGNMDFTPVFFHGAVEAITGYTEDDFVSGRPRWDEIIHPDDLPGIFKNSDKLRSMPGYSEEREYRIIHGDGSLRWVRETIQNVCDGDGKPALLQGAVYDITERKKMEEEILKSRKLESLGVLAGGIAHDFNNILTSILSNIYIAKLGVSPGTAAFDKLASAERASLRAQDLTKQLLTFSRGGTPVRETASIGELIRESADFALRGSNVRFEHSIADDLWPVEVDLGQISQVINNLMINADQAMPGGGTVTVRAKNFTMDGGDSPPLRSGRYVRLSVEDEGAGIPGKYLQKIFDPYFTTKQKGNGLGLATSYSIIRKHDGHIDVKSEMGAGTAFHVYLPASSRKIPPVKDSGEGLDPGSGRVLVMDDEREIRESVAELLQHFGYEAEYASDGVEAIGMFERAREAGRPFDLVILDLTVPGGMGGMETVKRLLAIDGNAKVAASSGYSNAPVMSDFGSHGFIGVIAKPFRLDELNRLLRGVMAA